MIPSVTRSSVFPWRTALLLLTTLGTALLACAPPREAAEGLDAANAETTVVTLRPDERFQTIRGFGASDAWSIQFVGAYWPDEKRERIADLLFSLEERENGSPAGIGLSAWRFNIGAGSARQGEESGIEDRWRRADSFLRPDGRFDPQRQAGQRAFLREAKERGVERFYAFANSPPVTLTRNGKAHSSDPRSVNLPDDRYDEYARFLVDAVVALRRNDGVEIDYLSPVNEPQWDWTGGQEGSPWTNEQLSALVRVLSPLLQEAAGATRIEIPETARMNYLYEAGDRPARGAQIRAFFDPSSPGYLGELPNLARSVAAHSYFTTFPADTLHLVRQRLREEILAVDPELELVMSEYCILENNPVIRGGGRDLGMDAALYVAGVIHADLVEAHASSWMWWLAVSPYDYKDGLVYIDADTLDGHVYDSKLLWTLGHYSRFVRPGMRRIAVGTEDAGVNRPGADLLVSGYLDEASGRVVAVLTNRGYEPRRLRLEGVGEGKVRVYRTSADAGANLRPERGPRADEALVLPPRSMTTIVTGS